MYPRIIYSRLVKEVAYYKDEVNENEEKLKAMEAANEDPYDIKKFKEVLDESYMMIPDSSARLKQSLQDLASYVKSSEVTDEYKSNEWYTQANELLDQQRSRYYEEADDTVEETKVEDLKDGEAF